MKIKEQRTGRGVGMWKRLVACLAVLVIALPAVAAVDKTDKKVAKLEKKIEAKEASIEAKELRIDEAEAEIPLQEAALVQAQLDLLAAQAMPTSTKAEKKAASKATKAANKAIKRAVKQINKLTNRISKLQNKITKQELAIDNLETKIEQLRPGGFPDVGSVEVAGLELPGQMTVVAPDVEVDDDVDDGPIDGGFGQGGGVPVFATVGVPQDSDYFNDEQTVWVYDPALDSLDSVNEILCMLRQTAYREMVNQGSYTAQIDPNLCGDGGSEDSQQGEVEEVQLWTVQSVRSDDDSEHVVGVWVPQDDQGQAHTIHARLEIVSEPDADNPYGVFQMDFEAVSDVDPQGAPAFWGTLETEDASEGNLGFSFFESGSQDGFDTVRAVRVDVDNQGRGVAHVIDTTVGDFGQGVQTQTVEFDLAFDDGNVLRSTDGQDETCLSRTDYENTVWSYNLYHAEGPNAGERVERNSGFGISTSEGNYGWIGYYGLWVEGDEQLDTGDVVAKNTVDAGDSPEQFTVLQASGKLLRTTRSAASLMDINGDVFEWWGQDVTVQDPPGTGGPDIGFNLDPNQQDLVHYQVAYTQLAGEFQIVATDVDGEWVAPLAPIPLDTAELGWLNLWSPALGGTVVYVHGDDEVTWFQEEVVGGNDAIFAGGDQAVLFGWADVPRVGITEQQAMDGEVFLPTAHVEQAYVMVLNRDDMGLYVMGEGIELPVGLADGETYEGGPFGFGIRSGPMLTDAGAIGQVSDLWDQEVFYTWETGPNDWNRLTTLVDSQNNFVDFEPPVQFNYVHTRAQDANGSQEFQGKTFQLEFAGSGQLHGIPHEGVDTDGDGNDDRWYPVFNLKDGTLVGPANEYVVRAVEVEQRLAVNEAGCDQLDLSGADALTLPDGSTFAEPNIGDQPVVDGPPAVIAGEVQEVDG